MVIFVGTSRAKNWHIRATELQGWVFGERRWRKPSVRGIVPKRKRKVGGKKALNGGHMSTDHEKKYLQEKLSAIAITHRRSLHFSASGIPASRAGPMVASCRWIAWSRCCWGSGHQPDTRTRHRRTGRLWRKWYDACDEHIAAPSGKARALPGKRPG